LALLPGRPLLYNGQEVESPQKLGLFEPGPVAWDQPQAGEARAFYRRVLELARTERAFIAGDLQEVRTSAPRDVIAYRRGDVVVLVNSRPHAVRITAAGAALSGARDLLSDATHPDDRVVLPAYGVAVLKEGGK